MLVDRDDLLTATVHQDAMETASSIVFAGIAPHPPIMVPDVGHEAIAEVHSSIEAMSELTRRVIASGAETLVIISPHAPLDATAFVAYQAPALYGDFANFRAPKTKVEALLDVELLSAIRQEAGEQSYEVVSLGACELDHGTAVPLYFLQRNGWHGKVVALGYSFLSNDDHLRFGACVNRAAAKTGRPVALVASGDLSHRLKPKPSRAKPTRTSLTQQVIALNANAPEDIINMDGSCEEWRESVATAQSSLLWEPRRRSIVLRGAALRSAVWSHIWWRR